MESITKQELIDLVKGEYIGKYFPYSDNDIGQNEIFINELILKLSSTTNLVVNIETNEHCSSSFVEAKLYEYGSQEIKDLGKTELEIYKGLRLYVSKTFPAFTLSDSVWQYEFKKKTFWQSRKCISSSSHSIEAEYAGSLTNLKLTEEGKYIKTLFEENNIKFLTSLELNKQLDFEIEINTIFNDPPYKVFDCLFHMDC